MNFPALVIFDMAGTTIEDRGQVQAAFKAALAATGITVTDGEITRLRGASKREAISRLLPDAKADDADRIYRDFQRLLAAAYAADGGVREIIGASDVIRDLRAGGIKVALTTGFDRDIAVSLMNALGWKADAVDAIVCGDDVPRGRPAPDMIFVTMKVTMVEDLARVANVGDTVLDLESASRAGVKWNIGVLSGAHDRAALERAPHTHIVQSVADIMTVFLEAAP
jgi:phosphonatase-like hydrolase